MQIMNYGIPYQASKNKIAKQIVDFLPAGDVLVDIFAGGCAITHAALLSGKWKRIIANDIGDGPQIFKAAINGEFENYTTVPDREQFFEERDNDLALALLYSFGNDARSYLWSKKLEPVKLAASRMVSLGSIYERKKEYRKFIRELSNYLQNCEGLRRLQRLQGLGGLQRPQGLEQLEISKKDYHDVIIPAGAVVYADPPYIGRTQECNVVGEKFNHEDFYEWVANADFPIYISEYVAPPGCIEVATFLKRETLNDKINNRKVTEKIFVQEKFAKIEK